MMLYTNLAGLQFRSPQAKDLVRLLEPNDPLELIREPTNPYDEDAIKVYVPSEAQHTPTVAEWYGDEDAELIDEDNRLSHTLPDESIHIGYVEASVAPVLAPIMDSGARVRATVQHSYPAYGDSRAWMHPKIAIEVED